MSAPTGVDEAIMIIVEETHALGDICFALNHGAAVGEFDRLRRIISMDPCEPFSAAAFMNSASRCCSVSALAFGEAEQPVEHLVE